MADCDIDALAAKAWEGIGRNRFELLPPDTKDVLRRLVRVCLETAGAGALPPVETETTTRPPYFRFFEVPTEYGPPGIYRSDPEGGDDHLIAEFRRIYNADALAELCVLSSSGQIE